MSTVIDIVVTVRWLEVTSDDIKAEALELARGDRPDMTRLKYRVLARMGITDLEPTPLDTYLKAMHLENGLPYTLPAHPAIANAIQEGDISRFVWWLS